MIHWCIFSVVIGYIYYSNSSKNCSEGIKGLRPCKCPGGDVAPECGKAGWIRPA